MDEELEEVDAADEDVGGQQILDCEGDRVVLGVADVDGQGAVDEAVGSGHEEDQLDDHEDEDLDGLGLVVFLGFDPLHQRQLLEDDGYHGEEGEQDGDEVHFGFGH